MLYCKAKVYYSIELQKPTKNKIVDTSTVSKRSRWRLVAFVSSVVFLTAVSLCLLIQPDWLAAVSIVPAWCWLLPGFLMLAIGYEQHRKRGFVIVLMLWVLYTIIFVEETKSLFFNRSAPASEWKQVRENGHGIRVVSLNCAGNAQAAKEVAKWKPDIVLLQESPARTDVEQLARELFDENGCFLAGRDTSLIASGKILSYSNDPATHFVYAELELSGKLKLNIVSLRLSPPVFRLDFWMPGFWNEHRNKRIQHRQQIAELMQYLKARPSSGPVIVGGDFNSPPNDAALLAMSPQLHDTFSIAGNGWGATGTSDYPLFRVDQIWASRKLQAKSVTAHKTEHSDHRIVRCDLILPN